MSITVMLSFVFKDILKKLQDKDYFMRINEIPKFLDIVFFFLEI